MSALVIGAALGATVVAFAYLIQVWRDQPYNRTFADYFFHSWSLRTRQVATTLFSSAMSFATVVVALMQLTGLLGIGLCYATLTFSMGWFLMQRAAPRIRARSEPSDTLHSFVGRYYGSRAIRSSAAAVTTIGLLGLFATELFAIDAVVKGLGLSPNYAGALIVVFGVFAIIHASLGGFRTVIKSDAYQSALLILSLLLLLMLGLLAWNSVDFRQLNYTGKIGSLLLPAPVLIGLFMINVPFPFVDTLTWQRLIASSSSSDYVKGSRYAVAGFCVTWTLLIFVALMASTADPSVDPLSSLLNRAAAMPAPAAFITALVLFPGFLAAMLSSSDAFLNSAGHTWCLDVAGYRRYRNEDDVKKTASIHVVWLGALGLLATIILRYSGFNIVDMIFAVYAGTLALFPCVIHAVWARAGQTSPRLRIGAFVSMLTGLLAAWATGALATVDSLRSSSVGRFVAGVIPIDVYQAPTYALIVSIAVYLTAAIVEWIGRRGLKHGHVRAT